MPAADDVQVVPVGSGVTSPQTVVVAQGPAGRHADTLTSPIDVDDVYVTSSDLIANSRVVGDDVPLVGLREPAFESGASPVACVDGSEFPSVSGGPLATRFTTCGVIKPGLNGIVDSQPAGDDVLVPDGSGAQGGDSCSWSVVMSISVE